MTTQTDTGSKTPSRSEITAQPSDSPLSRRGVMTTIGASLGALVGARLTQRRAERGASAPMVGLSTPQANAAPSAAKRSSHPSLADLNLDDFVVHGETPLTVEAKRHTIGTSVITHERHLFIRNNLPLPERSIISQPDRWEVEVGGVKNPRTITVAELKTLGLHTVAAVLQCSGNGRAFYTHGPSGSQWATGAAGCVVWSGVKVSDVVAALGGVNEGMRYLTSTGGDPLPVGVERNAVVVERSAPLKKVLEDGLLAWEMNGEPISLEHGGPLRLIIPGYFGCNQIKYVKQLNFTVEQTKSKIQNSGYRMRPIGVKGAPTQPSMWAMPLKSWITNPDELSGRSQVIRGVALGGERSISRVEVSVDGGKRWREAELVGPDLGRFAWRLFQVKVALPAGQHTLMSRAYDDRGQVQPEARRENERGYGHNGWRDHALTVTVSAELKIPALIKAPDAQAPVTSKVSPDPKAETKARELSAEAQAGRKVFLSKSMPPCGACHTLDDAGTQGAVGPNLNQLKPQVEQIKRAVSRGLGAMPAQTHLSDAELEALARYIVEVTQE